MKRLLFIILLLTGFTLSQSQEFHLRIQVSGMGEKNLYFGEYFGSKQFILDTLTLDMQGRAELVKQKMPEPGMYFFILPGNSYFDLLLGNCNTVSIQTHTNDIIGGMEIAGCRESSVFMDYQRSILAAKQDTLSDENTGRNDPVSRQTAAIREQYITSNQGSLVAEILQLLREPSFGLNYKRPATAQEFKDQYAGMVRQFLDSIDFSNPGLIHTPFLTDRITHYFGKLLDKQPDTIWNSIERIMRNTGTCTYCTNFWRQWLLEYFSMANFLGSDKVYVAIAEKYFLQNKELPVSKPFLDNLQQRVDLLKPVMWGSLLPEPGVSRPDGQLLHISDSRSDFTILLFYDLDCSSCRYSIEQLKELSEKFPAEKLTVCAVYMGEQRDEWLRFSKEDVSSWLHGFNPSLKSKLKVQYAIDYLPKFYLLDKNKRIIGSNISIAEANKIILREPAAGGNR